MSRGKRILVCSVSVVALALLVGPGLGGCFTPPLILPGGEPQRNFERLPYPKASEAVSIEVEPGVFLRGLFVPADEGAPIVVHLLESAGSFTPCTVSVAVGRMSMATRLTGRTVAWDLADRGLASLFVDYRGVGPSDGECDPRHLAGDAEAIYAEALRRAGGDESRLLLRGTSIGCLAAAHLLQAGRRPAAVVMIAPVRDETVVANYAYAYRNPVLAFVVTPWFRRGVGVDLERAMREAPVPALVITTDDDELLPPEEQALLRAAVAREGSACVVVGRGDPSLMRQSASIDGEDIELPGDHYWLAYAARRLLADERRLLGQMYPTLPDADVRAEALIARLPEDLRGQFPVGSAAREGLRAVTASRLYDDAGFAASLVLAGCTTAEAIEYLDTSRRSADTRGLPPAYWFGTRDRDATLAHLSLADPAGRVPVRVALQMAYQVQLMKDSDLFGGTTWELADVLAFARGAALPRQYGRSAQRQVPFTALGPAGHYGTSVELEQAWQALTAEQSLSESDACRLILRALLKGADIDERVVTGADGRHRLEVREAGNSAWEAVDPLILLQAGDG